jgi:hypothetical protein
MSYSFGFAIVVFVAEQNVILQRRCSWLECCDRSNHAAAKQVRYSITSSARSSNDSGVSRSLWLYSD